MTTIKTSVTMFRWTSIEGQWEDVQEIEHTVKLANGNFAVIIERQGTLPTSRR